MRLPNKTTTLLAEARNPEKAAPRKSERLEAEGPEAGERGGEEREETQSAARLADAMLRGKASYTSSLRPHTLGS